MIKTFELDWRVVAECAVATMRVVPAFEPVEDGELRLGLALEAASIEQLRFQGGEEALGHRVVVSVSNRAHRRAHAHLLATRAKGDRGVLRAVVGVMDDLDRTTLPERHVERGQDQLGTQVVWPWPTRPRAG